ncbi:MAG TPA: penicillin-binding transpeptidase domain-containing protein [Solirubrobacteraceae bacterium]|nr:penicillin-binding transpeptidase domain-containing protein [Solirubrobacteraceae bacterium]
MDNGGPTVARSRSAARPRHSRRRRLLTRTGPVVVLALGAFAAGVAVGSAPGRAERRLVERYVTLWTRGDPADMYRLLDSESRARVTPAAFESELLAAERTATVRSLRMLGSPHIGSAVASVQVAVSTRLWGTLHETLELPLTGSGAEARIHLEDSILFPGLRAGESLARRTALPARAALLSASGVPLAEGPARTSPDPVAAGEVVGTLGPVPPAERARYEALGYPPGAKIGLDGLERTFQTRLAGRPGGVLLAGGVVRGGRVLARSTPVAAAPVRTTISIPLEDDAIAALGGRYAGMAVMNPRTGGLVALAGLAYDAPQPPGSTMKIITATAALQAGIVRLTTQFPDQSSATIDGYTLHNANDEVCGGTLINAFAVSCNSVYAPLGARVGGRRLVATAERYGFDQRPSILGADESTIPSAATIGSALSIASSAIGQGRVLATPLEMADVAATIADGGRRPIPTLSASARPRFVRVTTPQVAAEIKRMMIAVVDYGTGVTAQIPGVQVAGKTGTAELRTTTSRAASNNPRNTDSWFVGFAPANAPRLAAAVLFPSAGYGEQTAAPAVRSVLESALGG